MSIEQITMYQWHKIFEDDEIISCGSFIPDTDQELQYMRHYFFIKGTPAGTEKVRTIIYSDSTRTSALYTSEWSEFADISDASHANWQGWIRMDFGRNHLKYNREYFFSIEIDGYTRNANTFYISAKFDYDNSVYDNGSDQFVQYPIATEFYTYKEFEE